MARAFILAFSSTVLALSACKTGGAAVPTSVTQQMAAIPISDRGTFTGSWADESFTMGPYRVGKVDRQATGSTGWKVEAGWAGAGATTWTGGYSYAFETPGGPVAGECRTQAGGDDTPLAREAPTGQIACRCSGSGLETEAMVGGPKGTWQGQVKLRGFPLAINSLNQYSNGLTSSRPLGFEVRGQVPVGAVETDRPGRVWLSSTLDAAGHAELACLFAGMLLFDSPRDHTMRGSRRKKSLLDD